MLVDGSPDTARAAVTAARGWDTGRLVLGFVTLTVAFNGTWHLVSDREETGPTALAVVGLIAALVALVVDLVLQRAVIGQDFDPVLRLGIRTVLVAPVVGYSVYDLLHGEFQDTSAGFGSFAHLMPAVGSGPVLALAGAAFVMIGPWKDRSVARTAPWQRTAAGTALLAAAANGYQAIRAVIAANAAGNRVALPIESCVTWFALAIGSALLGWALITGRRASWPVASLLAPCWVLALAWQTGLNTSYDGSGLGGSVDLLLKSFGTLGAGLLVVAMVLAAAPVLSLTADSRAAVRWLDGARGLILISAASLVVLAILAGAYLGVDDGSWGITFSSVSTSTGAGGSGAGGGSGDGSGGNGALVWILVCTLVLAAAAAPAWFSCRRPGAARLAAVAWGIVTFLALAITLLTSDSLQYLVSSDFLVVGRSVGTLAAGALVAPVALVCTLLLPASVRRGHHAPFRRFGAAAGRRVD